MRGRISFPQIQELVKALEEHPNLAAGLLRTAEARHRAIKLWSAIAVRVNAIGVAKKSGKEWAKYWTDKKSQIKKAVMTRAQAARRNDGCVDDAPPISDIEMKMLRLMKGDFATGDDFMIDLHGAPSNDGEDSTPEQRKQNDDENIKAVQEPQESMVVPVTGSYVFYNETSAAWENMDIAMSETSPEEQKPTPASLLRQPSASLPPRPSVSPTPQPSMRAPPQPSVSPSRPQSMSPPPLSVSPLWTSRHTRHYRKRRRHPASYEQSALQSVEAERLKVEQKRLALEQERLGLEQQRLGVERKQAQQQAVLDHERLALLKQMASNQQMLLEVMQSLGDNLINLISKR